ncbi:MAG: LysM peptidoglycan-binding domain-containing protein [Ardenticatenales bacterium]|nr:LysM peptidoglycan-binding domain-containing protein [Ardenticatenales bacterium]
MQERSQSAAIGVLILAILGVMMAWYWPRQEAESEAPIATEAPTPATPIATLELATPAPLAGAELVITEPHLVQPGETIQSIANQHSTSMALLAVYLTVDDLTPGNLVEVPVPNPAVCPSRRVHVVEPSDTLYSISQRYNVTIEAVMETNSWTESLIRPGDLLCIP